MAERGVRAKYEISTDPDCMQLDILHAGLAASYWSPNVRRDIVETAIRNSIVIGAFERDTHRQVAFARVVSDCATFAWLCDVWVDEKHRGIGLGKELVAELMNDHRLQTLRRWCLATKDAHGLYEQFGFRLVPAERWMEKKLPTSLWQAQQ